MSKLTKFYLFIGLSIFINLISPIYSKLIFYYNYINYPPNSFTQQTYISDMEAHASTLSSNGSLLTQSVAGIKTQLDKPIEIAIVGDSMMLVGFGPVLENRLTSIEGITTHKEGKYSTGLNRVDYYDWYKATNTLITNTNPDILIVMFGNNDGQPILDDNGHKVNLYTTKWAQIYSRRVSAYMSQFENKVSYIIWVGLPIPRTSNFHNKFVVMNEIFVTESQKHPNVIYVNAWDRFAVNGNFSQTLANDAGVTKSVKGSDGVHMTTHGGEILTDLIIKQLSTVVTL